MSPAMVDANPFLKTMLENNNTWAEKCDRDLLSQNAKGQSPKVLWFGCADSRVPESVVCNANPGDIFVHRNVANSVRESDPSAMAVLAFAVESLKVDTILVVGHYSCGGVAGALSMAKGEMPPATETGAKAVQGWLEPIKDLAASQLKNDPTQDATEEHRKLVHSNVLASIKTIESHEVIKKALASGRNISVQGWVYDVATGKLNVLDN